MARPRDQEKKGLFGGTRGEGGRDAQDKAALVNQQELQEDVETLEKEINELRAQYELYFMGVERVEPLIARDGVRAKLRRARDQKGTNTATKFKLQMLQARIVSLENYWGRVNREREAGTYKRDVDKVRRREAELAAAEAKKAKSAAGAQGQQPATDVAPTAAGVPAAAEGIALSSRQKNASSSPAPAGSTPPAEAKAPSTRAPSLARPAAANADDLTEPALKQLYQTYVTAKKRCGEQVDLRFEEMAASLKKQVPKLLKSTGAKAIEFKVVIKGGHAVLKAVPKS